MQIRHARPEDLPAMQEIFADARAFMRENGNPDQWGDRFPTREMLDKDLALHRSYVCEDNGKIAATFAFTTDGEPTYRVIRGGAWLDDAPYGVVHRIAAAKGTHGAASFCMNWCMEQCGNIRIDTHANNKPMQGLLNKLGYTYCGVIELENGRVKRYRLPRSILTFMQVLEYDRSFLASRILFDRFNGSLIISGAFGLFKKDTVIAAGGYDSGTMGEDMELVVKLHEYCTVNNIDYAIRYASDAICWTQAPERLRDLCKQRKRWHLGLFQSMYKHRVMFSNHRFGAVSFVSYFYFLIYELLSPFIEVFGVFTMVLAWWCDLINVPFMLLFFLIYAVFGGVLTLTAFFSRIYTADLTLSFGDGLKAVCLCLFELVFLRFILAWVRCTAFIGYRKKKLSWGRIERRKIDLK